jgi:N,N-dimethylformamidase
VAAGETLRVMVTTEADRFEASVVRLVHGDESPEGPGFREEEVSGVPRVERPGRRRAIAIGSYATVPDHPAVAGLRALTVQAWIWPTLPGDGRAQGLVARRSAAGEGWALGIEPEGDLALRVGPEGIVRTEAPLEARRWYLVAAGLDPAGPAMVVQVGEPAWPEARWSAFGTGILGAGSHAGSDAPLLLAALRASPEEVHGAYDGKLERPRIWNRLLGSGEMERLRAGADVAPEALVADWDLGADPGSTDVRDRGPHGLHGRLVNMPARAVTGRRWTGRETDARAAPDQYGAVHFHHDDLEDARWEPDWEIDVPEDLPSGVYAARLRAGELEDHVPFVVRPPRGRATAPIALLLPTLTYLAYANSHHQIDADYEADGVADGPIRSHPLEVELAEHPELGLSLYDHHADGSGCAYSSRLRPIVGLRPRFRMAVQGVRHLAADLYLVDWLEHEGVAYDVVSDEDLHAEGDPLLRPYRVVLTGHHPEYCTEAMLDGLEGYLGQGGHLMYLGGNGFYWVTSVHPERPGVIEVRRGTSGTRAWTSAPGEGRHSTTGEPGGLWRHRGRAPNRLVGVGFAAQGWDRVAPGYRRRPDSFDPRAAWVFDGVGPDEPIGDHGLSVGGGAAGDEIDRLDHALGSPRHALTLASSEGHGPRTRIVVEDLPINHARQTADSNADVRADMVLFETPAGGAVFSVGSMNWCGALSQNGYDNAVSRITGNVLREFSSG